MTSIERKFLLAYIENRCNGTEAYLSIRPHVTRGSAEVCGSKILTAIKKKYGWGKLLDVMGLDDVTIAANLKRLLAVQKPVFFQGEAVGAADDGPTQLRATELLAEFRGRKKVDAGEIRESVVVYIPDNSRESNGD